MEAALGGQMGDMAQMAGMGQMGGMGQLGGMGQMGDMSQMMGGMGQMAGMGQMGVMGQQGQQGAMGQMAGMGQQGAIVQMGAAQPSSKLYMRGLPLGITEQQLQVIVGAYGTVASCKVLPSPPTGATDCACIVQMSTAEGAKWLVENLDGNIPQGLSTPVSVKYKRDKEQGGGAQGAWGGGEMMKGEKGMGKKGGKGGKGGPPISAIAQRIQDGEEVFYGQVMSFQLEKKRGFIVSEGLRQSCGKDCYVFMNVLERAGAGPGDTVAFFVHWSSKDEPQASAPCIRIACEGTGEQRHACKGVFKSSPDGGGFGFIDCGATKEFFGRDVYVNKELAATVTHGQVVSFCAILNASGMPTAETLSPCELSWEAVPGDLTQSRTIEGNSKPPKGKGKGCGGWGGDDWGWQMMMSMMGKMMGWDGKGDGKGAGKWKGMMGGGKGKGGGGPSGRKEKKLPTPIGKSYQGVIKSFNQSNNYGFIECPEVKAEYGNDCFLHGKELEGQIGVTAGVGTPVYFEVGMNNQHKPQAMNVKVIEGGGYTVEPPAKRQKFDENAFQAQQAQAFGVEPGSTDFTQWAEQLLG